MSTLADVESLALWAGLDVEDLDTHVLGLPDLRVVVSDSDSPQAFTLGAEHLAEHVVFLPDGWDWLRKRITKNT